MVDTDGANGRLLTRIDERTKAILDRQEKDGMKLDSLTEQVQHMAISHTECAAIQNQKWEQHDKEHQRERESSAAELSRLNTKKNLGDGLAYLAAVVAAALGVTVNSG